MSKEKFLEIQNIFKRMSFELMCPVLESYYIWRTLTFARSITEVGQERADKNARLMSLYKDFFVPSEQSHLQTFIIGLMKFFDKDSRALSIKNLIEVIKENKSILTFDVLREVNPTAVEMGFINEDYSPIKEATISYIEQVRTKHEKLILNLKDIRDKQFAHTDMVAIKGTFVPNEIENLIKNIQEIINKLSSDFDSSVTIWDHIKEEAVRDTRFLLENLERGEVKRQEDIRKKYGGYNLE